jgi:hypothetical protein
LVAAIQAGGDTDQKVASMLNKQTFRTRTGARWTFGGVKYLRMLLGIPRQMPMTARNDASHNAQEQGWKIRSGT